MWQIINLQLTIIFRALLVFTILIYFLLLRKKVKYKILIEWKKTPKEELKTKLNEIISYTFFILILIYFDTFFQFPIYFAIFDFVILILIFGLILHPKKYAICEEGVFILGTLRKWNEFSYYKVKGNKIILIGKYFFNVSIENKEGVEKIICGFLKEKR